MARGRKKKSLSLDEELLDLEIELEKCQEEKKKVLEREENLKKQIKEKHKEILYQGFDQSGKDIHEFMDWCKIGVPKEEAKG